MFLHDLLLGLFWSLVLVAPVTFLAVIGSKHIERTLFAGVAVWAVYAIVMWLLFWWGTPPTGFSKIAIWHEFWPLFWALALALVIIGGVSSNVFDDEIPSVGTFIATAVLVVIGIYGIVHQGVWTNGHAKTLAHEVHVLPQKPQAYPDSDADHILQVPEETADFKANQVLASSSDRKLSTLYNVEDGTLQSVNNRLYWVYGLKPNGYRNSNKVPNAEVPGLIVVDAENPNTPVQLRLKDDFGHLYKMKYYLGGYHWHKLQRFLWANGYRDQVVNDLTLEVNDHWQPYYTGSLSKPFTLHRDVPYKALVVNPQTGKISTYAIGNGIPKNKPVQLPNWVDRVYSQDTAEKMLNWWGEWGQAGYNAISQSSANRYKVSGDPILVYTKGGHPVWQAIMTSYSRETSAAYLVLFDARDNEARFYTIQGLTLSSVAEHTILGSSKNSKNPPLQPVHMTLHKIYGHLTWVAPLIRPTAGSSASAQQGVALLPYDETNGDNVVIATSMASALAQYRVALANGQSSADPEANANDQTVEGKVSNLSQVVEGGQTVFYFTLGSDLQHVYRAAQQSSGSSNQNLELPFIKAGEKVRLTYLNTGSARRDVGAYDDLDLKVAAGG